MHRPPLARRAGGASLALLLALPASAQLPEGVEAQLDALAAKLLAADAATGFTVGALHGGARWVKGYGALEWNGDVAPDGETLYEIGSISKVFTGILLAEAELRGVLSSEDPLAQHLEAGQFEDAPIRLWHLATHTSGLPRMPPKMEMDPVDPFAHFTPDDLRAALVATKLRRAPGEKYSYSNYAAGTLGYVVASAQEKTYDELLAERICGPLGMRDTRVVLGAGQRARLAPGHDSGQLPVPPWSWDCLAGCGGIRSSVNDMLRFAAANLAPQGPLAAALQRALELRWDPGDGPRLGLGWHINRVNGVRWHNGQTGGYHAFLALRPEDDVAVVILSNQADGYTEQLGNQLYALLRGDDHEPDIVIEQPVPVAREVLERYVGSYAFRGLELQVKLEPQGLFAKLTFQGWLRLYPRSDTEFVYRLPDDPLLTFAEDGSGFTLLQGGATMAGTRKE
jgi:CubicO group peptidase (beta-lactamase class C family)